MAELTIAYGNIDPIDHMSDAVWIYGALNSAFQRADAPFDHWWSLFGFKSSINKGVNFPVPSTDL